MNQQQWQKALKEFQQDIGQQLLERRQEQQISLEQLQQACNIKLGRLKHIEQGHGRINLGDLINIAAFYKKKIFFTLHD